MGLVAQTIVLRPAITAKPVVSDLTSLPAAVMAEIRTTTPSPVALPVLAGMAGLVVAARSVVLAGQHRKVVLEVLAVLAHQTMAEAEAAVTLVPALTAQPPMAATAARGQRTASQDRLSHFRLVVVGDLQEAPQEPAGRMLAMGATAALRQVTHLLQTVAVEAVAVAKAGAPPAVAAMGLAAL